MALKIKTLNEALEDAKRMTEAIERGELKHFLIYAGYQDGTCLCVDVIAKNDREALKYAKKNFIKFSYIYLVTTKETNPYKEMTPSDVVDEIFQKERNSPEGGHPLPLIIC